MACVVPGIMSVYLVPPPPPPPRILYVSKMCIRISEIVMNNQALEVKYNHVFLWKTFFLIFPYLWKCPEKWFEIWASYLRMLCVCFALLLCNGWMFRNGCQSVCFLMTICFLKMGYCHRFPPFPHFELPWCGQDISYLFAHHFWRFKICAVSQIQDLCTSGAWPFVVVFQDHWHWWNKPWSVLSILKCIWVATA